MLPSLYAQVIFSYATLNLYTRLVIVAQPTGQRLVWPDTKSEGAPF